MMSHMCVFVCIKDDIVTKTDKFCKRSGIIRMQMILLPEMNPY